MNRSALRRLAGPSAVALSLTLALTACGGDASGDSGSGNGGSGLSGQLDGAGASSQEAAMAGWQAGFQSQNPDLTLNYDPIGSGGGREQFLSGGVAFAGSDAYMEEEELKEAEQRCAGQGGAMDLPHYISPVAVAYNLEGVDELQLSPETLGGIFAGDITNWNDPAIAKDNPDAQLPDKTITPVHRSDESGTTENFTDYLTQASGGSWGHDVVENWPQEAGGEGAQGTSGVVQAVKAGDGAIGYADASQVGDLGTVAVGVGDEYVEYSPQAAAKVVDVSEPAKDRPEGDLALDLARDTSASGAYPIVLVSYHIACKEYESKQEAEKVKAFMEYVGSEQGQKAAQEAAGSAPISQGLREKLQKSYDMIKTAG